ncbi:hypothetical protein ACVFI8_18150 [Agarivorans sp. MS3-6]
MNKYLDKGKSFLNTASCKLSSEVSSGLGFIKGAIGDLPVLMSLERSSKYDLKYDEKHYFVIPFKTSEVGFSLHTMRYLPDSVPEINDLPKRRVFHFPNPYYEGCLREHMLNGARELVTEQSGGVPNSLAKLADDIDALDNKLTYGMLFVGGLAAIFNPVVGVGIAAKALLPSATVLLTKYGLRPVGEKFSQSQLSKQIKQAERKVLKQFAESSTIKVINPILQELEIALRTDAEEHDPLTDPNMASGSIPELNGEHWRELTERAVYHVYKDTYETPSRHKAASLGPEDIRWFDVLFACVKAEKK